MENSYAKREILIVDDDKALLEALVRKFTLEGYSVLQAHDGEEGLKVSIEHHPSLIILDVLMPKMDGVTMMRMLRGASDWGKHVPIIVLTNQNPDQVTENNNASDGAPAYYLVKSNTSMAVLADKVKELLANDS